MTCPIIVNRFFFAGIFWSGLCGMAVCQTDVPGATDKVSDPTSSVVDPWKDISLTEVEAKPFFMADIDKKNFPIIPVLGGVAGTGAVTYLIIRNNKTEDCDFIATAQITNSTCDLSNGTVSVMVSPTDNYQYLWSTGATTNNLNNLSTGNYSVTVTKTGTTCVRVLAVSVTNSNPSFNTTFTVDNAECGSSNGSVIANVNPAGLYSITWSNGGTGEIQNNLAPGNYTVTVSAGGSCAEEYNVTVEELPPSFELAVTTTPSECGLATGSGSVTVNPPGNYNFEWSNGSTGANVSGLAAGEYNITVSITGTNCSKTVMATVDEIPPDFEITITPSPSDCGQSNGSGNVNVNPSGNYFYIWSNGTTGAQTSNLAPGDYEVSVSLEGTSCTKTASFTIEELPPSFAITSTTTPSGCGISTGTATITVDPISVYTYAWSNGATSAQVSKLAVGNYIVTVTVNGTSCSLTHSVTIEQTAAEFTGTISTDTASCGITNGSATITIAPPGEYTYLWSDQQTGNIAQQLGAGIYTVVVTDMNSCTASFSAAVTEYDAEYISIDNILPGTCAGSGEINFTLTTQGTGPLILQVAGPGGTGTLMLAPGSYSLASYGNLPSGDYSLTVYDEMIGQSCTEIVTATIPDNTPTLTATDDFYTTTAGQAVSGNVLSNDTGLNIEMISVLNEIGGTVTFTSSGDFIFVPQEGFSGNASFEYIINDLCGMSASAVVAIVVEEVPCNITIEVTATPASCGLDDGEIFVEVIEAGTYTYEWNNGDTGPQITNVYAGTYSVTVTEVNLGCTAAFTIELDENAPDYISAIEVTQPTCNEAGEITFVATSPGMNQLVMNVDHPNGTNAFFIDEGVVFLSDYISITPGQYTLEVNYPEAGSDCVESFLAVINQSPIPIEITLEAVIPPSEPTAMDGAIIVVVTIPGEIPYTVFLNGVPVFTTPENNFIIQGLGVGQYNVFISDAAGCESNILIVNVPPPTTMISLGTGIIYNGFASSSPEHAYQSRMLQLSTGLISTLQYFVMGIPQEWRLMYVGNSQVATNNNEPMQFISLDFLTEITSVRWKTFQVKLQGGIGVKATNALEDLSIYDHQHWIIRANAKQTLSRYLQFQCSLTMSGWSKPGRPVIDFSLNVLLSGIKSPKVP